MKTRSKVLLITLLVISVLAIGIGVGVFVWYWTGGSTPLPVQPVTPPATTTAPSTAVTAPTQTPLPDNPIDFATWQATNPDIYAWLAVPGTKINYPVLCASDEDDSFYLNHNIYKQYEFAGCIYSEKKNGRSLSDRNTVLYGHNMLNGTMFRTLHDFEDAAFFEEHDVFYIYTPGHIYTYTIFAAYEYDNRHLLNSFDYTDDAVWEDYLAYATAPRSIKANVRDVEVSLDDRIVTLSTCVGTNKKARYLVQGVLTDDQLTK